MKTAYVEPTHGGANFQWSWRSADGKHRSAGSFEYYFDCLQDARKHGYECHFERADPSTTQPETGAAPGARQPQRRIHGERGSR